MTSIRAWFLAVRAASRFGPARGALAGSIAAALTLAAPRGASACGGNPPPPFCGKTVVLGQALPGTQLLTGGGTLMVPTSVFLQVINFGGPACPPAPFTVKVIVTVTCPITGVSMGMVTVPIVNGYNAVTVPVVIPAGPPRVCSLTATATVMFTDGTAIMATAVTKDVCIAEPSPTNPALPRLDIQHAAGADIVRVHPGDQGRHRYIVKNNDLANSFTGSFDGTSEGNARLVTSTGAPEMPGNGPFTISDPTAGDNFNLAFGPIAAPGCVPLPPNPADPTIPFITRVISLLPGETKTVDVYVRPWGMCANGSCSKSKVKLGGMFSNGTPGLACTASILYADTGQPSAYQWLDGGHVPPVTATPPFCIFQHVPNPALSVNIMARESAGMVMINGVPGTINAQPKAGPGIGRFDHTLQFPPQPPNSFFDIFTEIEALPGAAGTTLQWQMLQVAPGAPHGFENFYPMGMGTIRLHGPTTSGPPRTVDSFFDVFFQVSLDGIDQQGRNIRLQVQNIQMMPISPTRATVHLLATAPPSDDADGPGFPLVGLSYRLDMRGFSRPSNFLFCPGDTNGDAVVNFADLNVVLSQFGQSGANLAGDINGDGTVNFTDLNFVLSNFGHNCGPTF